MAVDLSLSGLASGFDWKSVVEQLANVERAPQRRLLSEQSKINQRKDAVSSIVTSLESLQTKAQALKASTLYSARGVTSSDSTVATATADSTASAATYKFDITKLATAAILHGTSNDGTGHVTKAIHTANVDTAGAETGPTLSAANFATAITDGTFTVNGHRVTISASQTLKQVFQAIETATANPSDASDFVKVSYSAATDKITFTNNNGSTNAIVLGSSVDTSNFLSVTRLQLNASGNTGTVTSSKLGALNLATAGGFSNLKTTIAPASGTFALNGVNINYDTTGKIQDLIDAISGAAGVGVTASYDSTNDRFVLTNTVTGDKGISLVDNGTNILNALGFINDTTGALLDPSGLTRGNNAEFTLNGDSGTVYKSDTNTLTQTSHGIQGLTVTAVKEGATNVTVSKDTAKLKTAISDFVAQYNKIQSLIDSQTASTTDAKGKVTVGLLANDGTIANLASNLRAKTTADAGGSNAAIKRLQSLGYKSSGFTNTMTLEEPALLDGALVNSLSEIQNFFSSDADGFTPRVDTFLENLIGDTGSLVSHKDSFVKQSSQIDDQITTMEKQVESNRQRMISSFVAMETAQSKINQQMQFLTKRFG